jgi:hypothetical protein
MYPQHYNKKNNKKKKKRNKPDLVSLALSENLDFQ